jgi:predicted transcriptional regulator
MKVYELLFELANSDRFKIMLLAEKQKLKLSHISKNLDMTVAETSRHLQRLRETKLLEKDNEGLYKLTPFGQLTLSLTPSFDFISKHRDYFEAHTLSHLPYEFIGRIGELANSTFTEDVMIAFHLTENVIEEAKEYIWILSSQVLMSTLPFLEKAIKRGVKFQLILPKDLIPPPGFKPLPVIPNLIDRRILSRVDMVIVMSEKQARLAFLTKAGKMDYIGFGSTDEHGHKWCKDLFMHYWEQTRHERPSNYPA